MTHTQEHLHELERERLLKEGMQEMCGDNPLYQLRDKREEQIRAISREMAGAIGRLSVSPRTDILYLSHCLSKLSGEVPNDL